MNVRTAERLSAVVNELGIPKKKPSYSTTRTNDFIALLIEEDELVKELTHQFTKDKEREKLTLALINIIAAYQSNKVINIIQELTSMEIPSHSGTPTQHPTDIQLTC